MSKVKNIHTLHELELIRKVLEKVEDRASLEMIKNTLKLNLAPHNLQRRLDNLREEGTMAISGKASTTDDHLIYKAPGKKLQKADNGFIIPLSEKAKEILEIISKPVHMRRPLGYQHEFLINYRPNIDSYLSHHEKRKLAELGATESLDHLTGTYAKEKLQRFLIDLSWNSSRLEGNTYSLPETQQLILKGEIASDKSAVETLMILNHKEAIEFIIQTAEEIGFNRYTITNLHAFLSNLLLPDTAALGRLRTIEVGIGHSVFMPLGIPQRIKEMFELILEKVAAIEDPFEQSFFMMVHIPYLQPFDDVNKRVSRLATNLSLNKHNLAPLAFVEVPTDLYIKGTLGVYELNRVELLKDVYMWAYERSAIRYAQN